MTNINFRPYRDADRLVCISIFDANCPDFFAPNERQEYDKFLDDAAGDYEVCEVGGKALGTFGLICDGEGFKTLRWMLLDPQTQGFGVGSKIMERVIQQGRASQTNILRIAASHKSAPFFTRFGALATVVTPNGWGPGMSRVDLELRL